MQPNTKPSGQAKDLNGQSDLSMTNLKTSKDTTGHSVHFEKDSYKKDAEAKKIINTKKNPTSNRNVNRKLEFSKEHQERMATNVFDRLAGKKK